MPSPDFQSPKGAVEILATNPLFQQAIEQRMVWSELRRTFPDFGETTLKNARRAVRAREAARYQEAPQAGERDVRTFSNEGDVCSVDLITAKQITTPDQLLAHLKLDLDIWEVTKWECGAYQVGAIPRPTGSSKGGWTREKGELEVHQLIAIKATLTKRKAVETVKLAVQKIIEGLKDHAPSYAGIPHVHVGLPLGRTMGEFSIPDAHLGKYAWAPECGANYDTDIACDIYKRGVMHLLEKCQHETFSQLLYVPGNDFLNSDDFENRTTRGTTQSTDGRHLRTFVRAHDLAAWTIEQLAAVAPVVVLPVPGNHDRQNMFYLGEVLRYRFDKHPHVRVENTPTTRKYHEFHQVMLLFTHGDKEKHQTLGTLMASEQPAMWGRTRFREAHIGHLHKVWLDEQFGVRIRMMPSLCAAEDWHAEHGYVGNVRSAQAVVWDGDHGMTAHHFYNVEREFCAPFGR